MRVLAWSTIREFTLENASSLTPLQEWYRTCERADWSSFAEVRQSFRSVDAVGNKLIFNIGGNNYRLIARISFPHRRMLIRWIGTHAEYDRLTPEDIRNL